MTDNKDILSSFKIEIERSVISLYWAQSDDRVNEIESELIFIKNELKRFENLILYHRHKKEIKHMLYKIDNTLISVIIKRNQFIKESNSK